VIRGFWSAANTQAPSDWRPLPITSVLTPRRRPLIARCNRIKPPADFAAGEAKRLARKAKRKTDRAIASHGKWPVVDGVMFIPDPLNSRRPT
jgi:hypothetical protein